MVVQAYILVQTNVGKAAEVAHAISAIQGVTLAEDVTGPYDVIVRAEASSVDELGQLVVARVQMVRKERLRSLLLSTAARDFPTLAAVLSQAAVVRHQLLLAKSHRAAQGQGDQPLDELGIRYAAGRPHAREHRVRGKSRHGVDLVDHDHAVVGHEDVDSSKALAADRLEGLDRQLLHLIN
jgi:Lrp/AsnC ligand binding domain